MRADSAEGAVRLFPVRYDVKCSLSTALLLFFFNALFALCAFFTFSFFFFFVLFVAVVVTAGAVGPSCKKVAVGAVAPASKKPVPPGYSPFRNLVL